MAMGDGVSRYFCTTPSTAAGIEEPARRLCEGPLSYCSAHEQDASCQRRQSLLEAGTFGFRLEFWKFYTCAQAGEEPRRYPSPFVEDVAP